MQIALSVKKISISFIYTTIIKIYNNEFQINRVSV